MKLMELSKKDKISIQITMEGQTIEFPTGIFDIDDKRKIVYVKPIIIEKKVLSIDSEKCHVSVMHIRDDKSPVIWKNVTSEVVLYKSLTCYAVSTSSEGYEINRREAYRLFLGLNGTAQVGLNKKALTVIVKDVSNNGFSFVSDNDIEHIVNMPVRLVFSDMDQSISLIGYVVRKVVINEKRILYGCRLNHEEPVLSKYILEKQRKFLSMNKDNVSWKNREKLKDALTEPVGVRISNASHEEKSDSSGN